MAIRETQVTVGTVPVKLNVFAPSAPHGSPNQGTTLTLTLPSTVYTSGDAQVTTSGVNRGFPKPAGTWTYDLRNDEDLYGVVASGSVTVEVEQTGVRPAGFGQTWGDEMWGQ